MDLSFGSIYLYGLHNFLSIDIILLMVGGVGIGIIFGILPGLGTPMALAVFTPLTFTIGPVKAMVFLMGIYVGCVFGGSITAILLNIPGTPSAFATLIDGYPLALKGRAGEAIGIATISSATGGLFGALILAFFAPIIARVALMFGAEEYVALAILGLCMIAQISGKSLLKGLLSGMLGLVLSTFGADVITAYPRFTFNSPYLYEGIPLVALIVGIFGIGEVLDKIGNPRKTVDNKIIPKLKEILPRFNTFKKNIVNMIRSSSIGVIIGAIPAAGASIASIISYSQAKRASKHPEEFGKGSIEGISAAESANNASVGGALIPLLTLGLPGDPMGLILMGALMLHGLAPGPLLFKESPEIVSVIFISVFIAAILIAIIGVTSSGLFARIINVPVYILYPSIIILCVLGAFSIRNALFDVGVLIVAGLFGFFLRRVKIPLPPMLLGFILGPMLEDNMRRMLLLNDGTIQSLFLRPISASILLIAAAIIIIGSIKERRSPGGKSKNIL